MSEPTTVKLSTPIEPIVGTTFTELTIREPTGADLIQAGHPLIIRDGGVQIDSVAMNRLIWLCSGPKGPGLPADAVAALPAADWQACAAAVTGFLLRPAAT